MAQCQAECKQQAEPESRLREDDENFEPSSKSDPEAELLTAAEIYRAMKRSNPAAMRGTTAYAFSRMLPSLAQRVRRKDFNGYWVKRK